MNLYNKPRFLEYIQEVNNLFYNPAFDNEVRVNTLSFFVNICINSLGIKQFFNYTSLVDFPITEEEFYDEFNLSSNSGVNLNNNTSIIGLLKLIVDDKKTYKSETHKLETISNILPILGTIFSPQILANICFESGIFNFYTKNKIIFQVYPHNSAIAHLHDVFKGNVSYIE